MGAVSALIVQSIAPLPGAPLFDGVPVIEPYVWFEPPPDHPSGATGVTDAVEIEGGKSGVVAVATSELPPQAQLFGIPGALTILPGATEITVSITPIEPYPAPAAAYIDGNVYRFEVVDQLGRPLTAPARATVSIILRQADPDLLDATIARYDGTAWVPLETAPTGVSAFLAVVTEFGDFALVANGQSPYPSPGPSPPSSTEAVPSRPAAEPSETARATTLIAAGIALLLVLAAGFLLARRRSTHE